MHAGILNYSTYVLLRVSFPSLGRIVMARTASEAQRDASYPGFLDHHTAVATRDDDYVNRSNNIKNYTLSLCDKHTQVLEDIQGMTQRFVSLEIVVKISIRSSFLRAIHPSVGEWSSRIRCMKIALPFPGIGGSSLYPNTTIIS